MSNADGSKQDPNRVNRMGDDDPLAGDLENLDLSDADSDDPWGGLGGPEDASAEPLAGAGDAPEEVEAQAEEESIEARPKQSLGTAGVAVLAFCILSVLTLLALNVLVFFGSGFLFLLLINVFWLMATAIPLIMWMGRATLNFYEVVLGISLAAILIAVSLLAAEVLVGHAGEVTPRLGSAARPPNQFSADRMTTVA